MSEELKVTGYKVKMYKPAGLEIALDMQTKS